MRAPKATVLIRDKILFSFSGFGVAPVAFFIFLGLDTAPPAIFGTGVLLSAITALLFFPILYARMDFSVSVSVGRYHVPLAVATIVGAGFTAIGASAFYWFSVPAATVFFLIGFPIGVFGILIFFSVVFSIGKRMPVPKNMGFAVLGAATGIAGAALPFIALLFPAGGSLTAAAISTVGQLSAVMFLLAGVAVYFSSAPYMPHFVKLEESDPKSFKMQLQDFYGPFGEKKSVAALLGFFFASVVFFAVTLSIRRWVGIGVMIGAYAAGAFFGAKFVSQKNYFVLGLIAALLLMLSSVGMIVLRTLELSAFFDAPIFAAGFAAGLGRAVWAYRGEVAVRAGKVTAGIYDNFRRVLTVCAFAAAAFFCIAGSLTAYIAAAVSGIFSAACVILSREKTDALAMRAVDDFVTQEIMRDIKVNQTPDETLAELIAEIDGEAE